MRFLATANAFIAGQFIAASVQEPKIITLPDDAPTDHISVSWAPLDAKAKKALKDQGVDKNIPADQTNAGETVIPLDDATVNVIPKGTPTTP